MAVPLFGTDQKQGGILGATRNVLSSRARSFLRALSAREQSPRVEPRGKEIQDYSLFAAYGYQDLAELMRLEYDLQARYIDYEDMDDYPETASALTIYADEATQTDTETGKTVWIEAEIGDIKDKLETMLRRIKMDSNEAWEIARTLVKYGNNFEENLISDMGLVGLGFLPPATMRRIEKDKGSLVGFIQSVTGTGFNITPDEFEIMLRDDQRRIASTDSLFEPWMVTHFRLRSKYRKARYGYSVLESARWIWKRLMLLEDSYLVYKLTRAPARWAFYIDVGDLPPQEAKKEMDKIRQEFKKKSIVDPKTGRITTRFNPLSSDEDFFISVRKDRQSTRIENIEGPSWQAMDEIEYFHGKLFSALMIPKAYLGYEGDVNAKATLSQEDIRFSRTILRIQRELREGFRNMCNWHLASLSIDPSAVDYQVHMTVPSSIFELANLEVRSARAELADKMRADVSQEWIWKEVYGFSDEEIQTIIKQRKNEVEAGGPAAEEVETAQGMVKMIPTRRGVISPLDRFDKMRGVASITEEDFRKGNRDHEKRMEDNFGKLMKNDVQLSNRLVQTYEMMKEIRAAIQKK